METIKTERYKACFELYLRYGGRNLSRIEREMRGLGYADFNRRILYGRKEGGIYKPGWIEKYGWKEHLPAALPSDVRKGSAFPKGLTNDPGGSASAHAVTINTGGTAADNISNRPGKAQPFRASGGHSPKENFSAWLKSVSPEMTWDWKYQQYIYKHLQRVTDGTCKRLMIFLPPRHGKSELVTVRYAGWRLWNDPKMRVIVSSYNQKLADKFSRSIRRLLSTEEDRLNPQAVGTVGAGQPEPARPVADGRIRDGRNSPVCSTEVRTRPASGPVRMFPPSRTMNTVSQWETAVGGGVKAVGVGAGVTGFGAQFVVIDDPVKSRAEAESETYRDKLWDWYNNDLYTRLEPGAAMVLIQTRWHQDDLAGRLLNQMKEGGDQWDVINLPALAEGVEELRSKGVGEKKSEIMETNPPLPDSSTSPLPNSSTPLLDEIGRLPGQALCPERYDEAKLAEIQRQLGTYCFSALYQQSPTPSEGGIVKRSWFKKIVDRAPQGLKWKRGYDLAVSTKTSSCYTASFRIAYDDDGNMYIADGFRKRIEYPHQKRYIIGRVKEERDTEHGIERAIHGQALVQELRRETRTYGKSLRGIDVTNDKVTRALKWAPLAEEGKVILVSGGWNREFLDEVCQFPGGQFDDQIDAVSLAVTMFEEKGRKMWSF